jgi:hypothetical protein
VGNSWTYPYKKQPSTMLRTGIKKFVDWWQFDGYDRIWLNCNGRRNLLDKLDPIGYLVIG